MNNNLKNPLVQSGFFVVNHLLNFMTFFSRTFY